MFSGGGNNFICSNNIHIRFLIQLYFIDIFMFDLQSLKSLDRCEIAELFFDNDTEIFFN